MDCDCGLGFDKKTLFCRREVPEKGWERFLELISQMSVLFQCVDASLTTKEKDAYKETVHLHLVPPRINQLGIMIMRVNKKSCECIRAVHSKLSETETARGHINRAILHFCTNIVETMRHQNERKKGNVSFHHENVEVISVCMNQTPDYYMLFVMTGLDKKIQSQSITGSYKNSTLSCFFKAADVLSWLIDCLSPHLLELVLPKAPASGV